MCGRCIELDRQLAAYRWLLRGIDDRFARALITEELQDLEAQKIALHTDDLSEDPSR